MARFILDVNDERGTTIIPIQHDMGVVMDIAGCVVVLDLGQKIAEGTPGRGEGDPARDQGLPRHEGPRRRGGAHGGGDAAPSPS